jgi:hypothetical protein
MMEPQSNVSAPPHAPPRGDAVMVMFERFILFVLLYTVLAPAVPFIFAWKRGTLGVWSSTVIALLLLVLLHASLWPACAAANCGQGAVILIGVWGAAAASALATLTVGVLMAHFRR